MGRKIYTDEELKEHKRLRNKKRYQEKREKILEQNKQWRNKNPEYLKQWREKHPDYQKQYNEEYYDSQIGRANNIVSSYRKEDEKNNRGECTITKEWIIDNIFTSKCFYCGESDWHKLGCDRIDNDLPHTPDNIVPCCWECNRKRKTTDFEEFCKEMGVEPIIIAEQTII